MFSIPLMERPLDAARRRRFVLWFERTYGTKPDARTRFMADSGKRGDAALTPGRVTQLFDEKEAFGERAAKNLATRFGLPETYFLADEEGPPLSQGALDVARSLDHLKSVDPQRWRMMLAFCSLASIPDPPEDPARRKKWVEDMVDLFQASVGLTADR